MYVAPIALALVVVLLVIFVALRIAIGVPLCCVFGHDMHDVEGATWCDRCSAQPRRHEVE